MTRILIFTDLHGSCESAERIAGLIISERADMAVSLGDVNYSGARNDPPAGYSPKSGCSILSSVSVPGIYIKGNCDSEIDEMVLGKTFEEKRLMYLDGRKVLFTHGHRINPAAPPPEGYADDVIYGHTHINAVTEIPGTKFINVASITMPKGGAARSYAVIENGVITIKDIDGNTVLSTKL